MRYQAALVAVVVLVTPALITARETQRRYLSGKGTDDAVRWDFFCTAGAKSGQWTSIPVPSCWDALGFGSLNYREDKPPFEQGKYKRTFTLPPAWEGQHIELVFDGVLTDTQVWINGHSVGEKHQGGFYRFSYDVTPLLKFGAASENLIEVSVDKHSADASINRAERQGDYWMFGGIFRPVWLEAKPPHHIERVAIDAKADGSFAVDVFVGGKGAGERVEARVRERDGAAVSGWFAQDVAEGKARVSGKLKAPKLWTAETPNLHELEVRLMAGEMVVHTMTQRFGFRTVEVRAGDGVYVNGRRIILKGSNRHSFHAESGRALSPKVSRDDVLLMKEMNHNAVRMSHYPPDEHFLDACDELGLYVLDELAGWQKSYDTEVGRRLIGQMVRRDVNHPSILFWDNGNEGGWNMAVDDEFAKWDPQQRKVLHPWELFRGISTRHYRTYDEHVKLCNGPDVYFPTEFLHGMYDGGAGAGLADYWDAVLKGKSSAGGFIWATVDETMKRPDSGEMDTAGNQAPDGIVGPYRQKEAGFYTIKDLWSPIQVRRVGDGFEIENRYTFTNARQCRFTWELTRFVDPLDRRTGNELRAAQFLSAWSDSYDIAPGESRPLKMELPPGAAKADALSLRVDDPFGKELWTWVWPLRDVVFTSPAKSRDVPLARRLRVAGPGKLTKAEWGATDDGCIQLDYAYTCEGDVDFHGICFDLPEETVKSMRWLGQGPHRVWKNRLAGTTLGVWDNAINDTITGHAGWTYPEFRGCYAGVRWMRLDTTTGPIVIAPQDPSLYVQVLKPKFPPGPESPTTTRPLARNAQANLPDAGLAILHAIPPIGNKFHRADQTGPQGQPNRASGDYRGRVRFFFGDPPRE